MLCPAIHFGGMVFDDPTFGEPFEWRDVVVPPQVRRAVIEHLRAEVGLVPE
ncbi:hypothetical protein [Deinococcus humi]|uniref:Uncharacterized protein n=1 Tax=Deinococcus humi TaxID=662880 RepID=A0A7W8JWX1_9DEIO|nr:hypothetical protein [Deinococcus humi]MBB5364752.1 hypothetical protein [Deinococcus humi]GGO34515.1 hypothetical protein GCM10008949_35400 [Deinococcus humi]